MLDTIAIDIQKIENSRIAQLDPDNIKFGRIFADHMFMADYKEGSWRDLRIVPYDYLRLSPAISALHYGQSIFEGLKAYKTENGDCLVFRPHDNFRRLNISAKRMCMPEIPEEIFIGGLTELLSMDREWIPAKPGTSLYIRPYMFATDEYIGISPSNTYKFIIFTCPVGAYYAKPVKVKIETKYARAFEGGTGFAKAAGNYAASLYPAKLAQLAGYDQLLWTDAASHQYIEESGTMNVMFLINNTLITSPTSETILKGITRDSVLTLAKDWGYDVEERKIKVSEVIEAIEEGKLREVFGTGTAATIAHISQIAYQEKDFALPPVEERPFSQKVLHTLNEIKIGKMEDKFNWNYKIP